MIEQQMQQLLIKNTYGQIVPFRFRPAQYRLAQRWTMRNIIFKDRQLGISTFILARFLVQAKLFPGTICLHVCTERELAHYMLRALSVMAGVESEGMVITLDNDSQLYFFQCCDRISVGKRPDKVHLSEVGNWPDKIKLNQLIELAGDFTEIAVESTTRSSQFNKLWRNADKLNFSRHRPAKELISKAA